MERAKAWLLAVGVASVLGLRAALSLPERIVPAGLLLALVALFLASALFFRQPEDKMVFWQPAKVLAIMGLLGVLGTEFYLLRGMLFGRLDGISGTGGEPLWHCLALSLAASPHEGRLSAMTGTVGIVLALVVLILGTLAALARVASDE